MMAKFKVVCCTPAGRRRYMQYLIPFVVSSDVVDRYDIWINTENKQDIEFFRILSEKFPVINLVYQPDGIVNGIASINAFYRRCVEEDTVYFKLDDDIVWMEPGAIEKMVRFRIDNPGYFIVSPLVINNALCTYVMQNAGKIRLSKYCIAQSDDETLWKSGRFAARLHDWFYKRLSNKQYENIHCGTYFVAMNRFSINAILWSGNEMKKFSGIVPGDDEEWLSVIKPTELGAVNCINGKVIVVHFAFYTQREFLDKEHILERYGEYLRKEWSEDAVLRNIDNIVRDAMNEVEQNVVSEKPEVHYASPVKRMFDNIASKWKASAARKASRKKNRKQRKNMENSVEILD